MKHSTGDLANFPPEVDMNTPTVARIYDAMLGGKDNFEVDRQAMAAIEEANPGTVDLAQANRAYLTRGVDCVAKAGVRQFLDLGSGLPTADNTHQIARRTHPDASVVYVDNDPIVLAHGRAILAETPRTSVATADLTDVEGVLAAEDTQRLIDFSQPVCLMLVSLLHCIPDEQDPFGVVRAYFDRFAPGSCLVYSHIVSDDETAARDFTDRIHSFGTSWGRVRSPEEAAKVFDQLELVSPSSDGTFDPVPVECSTWRNDGRTPEPRPADPEVLIWEHAGIAFKH
ncbi:SAM-dependent methyltransferase [Allosalinactinospora lopnorensis]|uniref:SAM-dependent methyltransferase n=1 Tax=Allosalinactinospora lopnorensis TaxID=1352348 RepID=UPI000623CE3D|nr:SAM-dependent methyltransferase [Allosalinactinospora lopnorensis]